MRNVLVSTLLAAALGMSARAHAQAATSSSVTVELGATQSVSVGYAKGLICDDLSVVDVALKDGTDSNSLEVTGRKLGATLCRVGLDPVGPKVMVTIQVVPPKKPGQASKPPVEDQQEATPEPEEAPAPAKASERDGKSKSAKGSRSAPPPSSDE